jgi:uncharacterized phage-associated protein
MKGKHMSSASEIGKIVVNKCLDKKLFINTQKLQKLLVLMQIECVKKSGFPLFLEDIRVWDCGVVIEEVDKHFRPQGRVFKEKLPISVILLNSEEKYVDNIINKYGSMSADELNSLLIIQKIISWCETNDKNKIPFITVESLKFRI